MQIRLDAKVREFTVKDEDDEDDPVVTIKLKIPMTHGDVARLAQFVKRDCVITLALTQMSFEDLEPEPTVAGRR